MGSPGAHFGSKLGSTKGLILCNSDIIFRITFIIKLQTSCGAIVTL